MKTKFGSIIVDGRGKIGGHVASKNRAGSYLRTKVTPANGKTVSQNSVRAIFTELSQGWRGLDQAQRDAWNAAVTAFSKTNIFGDLVNPSGANLYQRLNNNLLSVGETPITSPPLPSAVAACTILTITVGVLLQTMVIDLSNAVPTDTALKVFGTAPMSAGKSFVKSEFRQIAVLPSATATPYDLFDAYLAKFGSLGSVGQKIFLKVLPINTSTGQAGATSSAFVISIS